MNLIETYNKKYNVVFVKTYGSLYSIEEDGFVPVVLSNDQREVLEDDSTRRLFLGNRRTGKTVLLLFDLIANASKKTCTSVVLTNKTIHNSLILAWTKDIIQDFGNIGFVQTKSNTIVLHNGSIIVFDTIGNIPDRFHVRYDFVYIDEPFWSKSFDLEKTIRYYAQMNASILASGSINSGDTKIDIFKEYGFSIHDSSTEEVGYPSELRNVVLSMYEY